MIDLRSSLIKWLTVTRTFRRRRRQAFGNVNKSCIYRLHILSAVRICDHFCVNCGSARWLVSAQ